MVLVNCYLITDPRGATTTGQVTKLEDKYHVEFTPNIVGPHILAIQYGGQSIPGSPYRCNVYDISKVRVTDVSQKGIIGNDMGFTGGVKIN